MHVDASVTVRPFFESYYVPVCMGNPQPGTLNEYRCTLTQWEEMTVNPPIGHLTVDHRVTFRTALLESNRIKSVNTVRKHLRQLQVILDRAGPPAPRRRDAAGLIDFVPWIKPPRPMKRLPRRIEQGQRA